VNTVATIVADQQAPVGVFATEPELEMEVNNTPSSECGAVTEVLPEDEPLTYNCTNVESTEQPPIRTPASVQPAPVT